MARPIAVLLVAWALIMSAPARADPGLDSFARDVDRAESVRAVKTLQRSFAQFAQFGLWDQVGGLFAARGVLVFDGQVKSSQVASGPQAIAAWLRGRYGSGQEGPATGGLSTFLIENAIVNLASDGESAKARWNVMILHGRGDGARVEGGILENDYVREDGRWKIATLHYYPQFDGPLAKGWENWGGDDLPVVPYHYDTVSAGIPVPPPLGAAPQTDSTLGALQQLVTALNEEDRIRNLQAAYGYYQDRKMWADVADLFAADGVVEVAGQGVWKGRKGINNWLVSMGPPGLAHGELNARVQFDTLVTLAPGGNEAFARGIELGTLGQADKGEGAWEIATFVNRFVRDKGVWKFREMRRFPIMTIDVRNGPAQSGAIGLAPVGRFGPDMPVPAADAVPPGLAMPAFIAPHPVTGLAVSPAGDARMVATTALTGPVAATPPRPIDLAEARRRLARSAAWDGITNVSAAYGNFLDDGNPAGFAALIATKGFKVTPFAGYYIGSERVAKARISGKPPLFRPGIPYHWLIQPVLLVSEDGRSASGRFELFHPNTGKAGGRLPSGMQDGIYHNGYVLENGNWRIWDLSLDEPYYTTVAWQDGLWAGAKDPPPPDPNGPPRSFSGGNFPPDIPLSALGKRMAHFPGGTDVPWQWPTILPMWFGYVNPVSGRVPDNFQPDCVPCAVRPDLRFDANGYQQPPGFPEANRSP